MKHEIQAAAEKVRESECHARSKGRCLVIAAQLGWDHGTPLSECDICFSRGAVWGEEAAVFRTRLVNTVLQNAVANPTSVPLTVRGALIKHVAPPERAAFAASLGTLPLHPRDAWQRVRDTWTLPPLRKRIFTFLYTMTGGLFPSFHPTVRIRHRSCFGDISTPPCPMLKHTPKGSFCGACGCGESKLARLDGVKLRFRRLMCPLNREGFSDGTQPDFFGLSLLRWLWRPVANSLAAARRNLPVQRPQG